MNIRARIGKLEDGRPMNLRADFHPDLWPLIGSRYTHEDFIELLAKEAAVKEARNGNA